MSRLNAPLSWLQRHARGVAFAIWLTGLLLLVATLAAYLLVLFGSAPGVDLSVLEVAFGLVLSLGMFLLLTCGALIVARWPGHPMGWLFCGVGLLDRFQSLGTAYEVLAGTRQWPLLTWVVWLASVPDLTTFLVLLIVVPYLFPSGRLLSRRWRPLLALSVALIVNFMINAAFAVPEVGLEPSQVDLNPVYSPAVDAALGVVAPLGFVVVPLTFLGGVASLVVRFRRSRGIERLQLRWLFWMIGLLIAAVLTFLIGGIVAPSVIDTSDEWNPLELALGISILLGITCGIPAVLGLSILRYRLYSVDVVINRTLVYGALTIGLAVTYWVGVLLLRQALAPLSGNSDIAIVVSTLGVAVLFQPLRRRIQALVDRRFYRTKYDAQRVVATFSSTARNEVDLDRLKAELVTVVWETIRPTSVSLWLREP